MKQNSPTILYTLFLLIIGLFWTGCTDQLKDGVSMFDPRNTDYLKSPNIINTSRQFGHLGQFRTVVPATTDIFLANAEPDTYLEYTIEGVKDIVPENSPIRVLKNVRIDNTITLDIYASGITRHLPLPSIKNPPNGAPKLRIEAGPALEYESVIGNMGALVGLFDNQNKPFIIGENKIVQVPRGAESLFLAVLDYPGASANNEGQYVVTINIIRR